MEINKEYYTEDRNKVVLTKTKKKQIILGHTSSNLSEYVTKIKTRYNGKYNRLPAFIIGVDGVIYQMYDPQYYSRFMQDEAVDKIAIPVMLENVGWVIQDGRDNLWYDWKGHVYEDGMVVQKEWRNKKFWAGYSTAQMDSLVWLINDLCTTQKVPKSFVGDNRAVHKPQTFKGVINKSNYCKDAFDLSPAMDFDL
jgi:hypothetical protein